MGNKQTRGTTPLSPATKRDIALATFLRSHHSAIGLGELREIGFEASAIRHMVERQTLVAVRKGAYRSGAVAPNLSCALRCGLLAVGEDAAIGRASAAHRLGLIDFAPRNLQVVVPRRGPRRRRDGMHVIYTPTLLEREVGMTDKLRCTIALRTILDLATATTTSADFKLLRRAVRQATVKNTSVPTSIERIVHDRGPFRGSRVLAGVLCEHLADTAVLRSDLEAAFLDLCREGGIPLPATNVMVEGHEVDMAWLEAGVVVELDTYAYHGDVRAFERDRARDADLTVAGIRIIRVTQQRLEAEPAKVLRQTRQLVLPHARTQPPR